ncbi:MAG: TonB-dependent receptor [Saprospiraceae bacterium]|nr:TonB-dependent receptor [Lewinella sp.]
MSRHFLLLFCYMIVAPFVHTIHAGTHAASQNGYQKSNRTVSNDQLELSKVLDRLNEEHRMSFAYETAVIADIYIDSEFWTWLDENRTPGTILKRLNKVLTATNLVVKKLGDTYLIKQKLDNRTGKLEKKAKTLPALRPSNVTAVKNSGLSSASRENGDRGSMPLMNTQQNVARAISGQVTDEKGEGLPGVTIRVKDSEVGTITDFDGSYTLEIPDEATTLIFSFIGFVTIEEQINNRTRIDVSLEPDVAELQEVVVIGYGSQKKSDLTGAVTSVDSKSFHQVPKASLGQGLSGLAPGVLVSQGSSAPGGEVNIVIRGGNSLSNSNAPLYVIDGVPITSDPAPGGGNAFGNASREGAISDPLASINPNDIESIQILKDASATAIYGSRGANGVILITTKSGKTGAPKVSYNAYYGVQNVAKKLDLLNAQEFAELANDYAVNRNEASLPYDGVTLPRPEDLDTDTDWQDLVFRSAPIQDHQLSVAGGTDNLKYYLSASYFDQVGTVIGSDFSRGTMRANMELSPSEKLTIGTQFTLSRSQGNIGQTGGSRFSGTRTSGIILETFFMSPTLPVKRENGTYSISREDLPFPFLQSGNPVADGTEIDDIQRTNRLLGNLYANYEILPGLSFKTSLATNIQDVKRNVYQPSTTFIARNTNGFALQSWSNNFTWVNENILTFNRKIGRAHHLNIVGAFTLQEDINESARVQGNQFVNDVVRSYSLGDAANPISDRTFRSKRSLASYLGRINYNLLDRYLFTISARADGSSVFGANNKWGFFPSAAVAWKIHEEPFMQSAAFIDNFKARVSYGAVGNSISPYQSISRLTTQFRSYTFGDVVNIGFAPDNIGNPDLKWETTNILDIGLDLGFFNYRLKLTADYYNKQTKDLLLFVPIPGSNGFGSALRNAGSIENKGLELSLDLVALQTEDLRWSIRTLWSANRNKVLSLSTGDEFFARSIGYGIPGSLIREGEPVGKFYLIEYDGIIHDQAELDRAPIAFGRNHQLGDQKFVDQNGDGVVDNLDRTYVGDPNPDYIYSLINNFSYKNIDLSVILNGSQGNDVLFVGDQYLGSVNRAANKLAKVKDRWTPDNPNTDIPRAGEVHENQVSSRIIYDGSFLRISNVTLGYNLPVNRIFSNARIYISGQNLHVFTKYPGYDPEVNTRVQDAFGAGGGNGAAVTLNQGVDKFGYPASRTFLLGINATFK